MGDAIKYLIDKYQIHALYGDRDTILLDSTKLTPEIINEIREKFNFEIERESLNVPRARYEPSGNFFEKRRSNSEFLKKQANDSYGLFFHNR